MFDQEKKGYQQLKSERKQLNMLDYSSIHKKSLQIQSHEQSRHEIILNEQKSIVRQNLDRLRNLLSQNKQKTRRNRLQLSPDMVNKISSPRFDKQNKIASTKITFSNTSRYRDNSKHSTSQRLPKVTTNELLISDIKKKIKGSSSIINNDLLQNNFLRNIISPQTVYMYQDKQIKTSKNIYSLVVNNQKLDNQLQQKNNEIKQNNQKVDLLQSKLQHSLNINQKLQEKFHFVIQDKDEQINRLKRQFANDKTKLQFQISNYMIQFTNKMRQFEKKVNIKLNRFCYMLEKLHTKSLSKAGNKIKLQKLIFQNQQVYRKSKNALQQSPSVKGDTFQQLQLHRHDLEKQIISKQLQYEKNEFQKKIHYHQLKYDQLYLKFLETQRKNLVLNKQLQIFIGKQLELIRQRQNNERQWSDKQKQRFQLNKCMNQRPAYVKKEIGLSSPSSVFMTPKQTKQIQTYSVASQAALDRKRLIKTSYLNQNMVNQDSNDQKQLNDKTNKQRKFDTQNKQRQRNRLMEQEKAANQMRQTQRVIIQQQIIVQQQRRKHKYLQQQSQLRRQYQSEIQHIKNLLKTIQENAQQPIKENEQQPRELLNKEGLKKPKFSNLQRNKKNPHKMKQIVKVQGLAKKQKKQKQIVKFKLQHLERELIYEKQKNRQLQTLIQDNEKQIFQKIRQQSIRYQKQNEEIHQNEESMILEEQTPFDTKLKSLNKSRIGKLNNFQSLQWQNGVKDRLQDAIQRLQALEKGCSRGNLSNE